MSQYEDMTNADMKELCEELGLDVEAKNPAKPNKAELSAALDAYYGVTEEAEQEPEVEIIAEKPKASHKKKEASLRKKQYDAKMKKVRVMVTSNADNQTKHQNRTITWGNRVLGHNTDIVVFEKPWYIRQGALDNMKNATIVKHFQNDDSGQPDSVVIPAYNIVELGHLSEEEIKKMARNQQVRNAALGAQDLI